MVNSHAGSMPVSRTSLSESASTFTAVFGTVVDWLSARAASLVFLASERRCLAVAVRTEQSQVFDAAIRANAVLVVKL